MARGAAVERAAAGANLIARDVLGDLECAARRDDLAGVVALVGAVDISGRWSVITETKAITTFDHTLMLQVWPREPGGEFIHHCFQCGNRHAPPAELDPMEEYQMINVGKFRMIIDRRERQWPAPEKRHENELESVTERRRTHAGESLQRSADHRDFARA